MEALDSIEIKCKHEIEDIMSEQASNYLEGRVVEDDDFIVFGSTMLGSC